MVRSILHQVFQALRSSPRARVPRRPAAKRFEVEQLEHRDLASSSPWLLPHALFAPPASPHGPAYERLAPERSIAPAGARAAVRPFDGVRSLIQDQIRSAHLAGVSVAVVRGTELLFSGGFGQANIANRLPMTAATPQLLASVSKTVTAVAAMQLVEKGQLSLDADINRYLPFSVRNPSAPGTPITVRMLMTHTSSIVDNDTFASVAHVNGDSPIPLGQLMRDYLVPGGRYYSRSNFLRQAPGQRAEYSNLGIALLGHVVEAVARKPFDQYCREHIFVPLGMTSTSWKLAGMDRQSLAMPYEYVRGRFRAAGHYGFPDYPNGQLRSSALDMSRFLRAFMNGGELGGARILSAASVAEMRRIQAPNLDRDQGLTWFYDQLAGDTILGHDGGEEGVNTFMFYRPRDQVGVLVFSNTSAASSALQDRQDNAIRTIAAELFRRAGQA